jgi:predicted metal-dependent peptidase
MGIKGKQSQDHSQWNEVPISAQHSYRYVLQQALQRARGELPLGLKRLLKLLQGDAQIKWYERLRKMAGNKLAAQGKRYTYKKQSRRHGWGFPGTTRLKRGILAVYLDTSGSMDDTDIAIAVRELKGIADAYGAPFELICADAEVQKVQKIAGKFSVDRIEIAGGGGTDSKPVFKYLEKKNVDLMVGITDGWNVYPAVAPKYQVIWVCQTEVSFPWGEVLRVKREE